VRKYPKVLPKFRNPAAPGETWSGRGKRPKWLVKALAAGRKLEDFRIPQADAES
jgi:DNA-binding protein H-NS